MMGKKKPPPKPNESVKVKALMSIPRLGWNDSWGCIVEALSAYRIGINRVTGAYWSHCMECGLEDLIAEGQNWAIVIDYDSMFRPHDVQRLLQLAHERDDIHAVTGFQVRRGALTALLSRGGVDIIPIPDNDDPIQVDTAHFGCTLIKLDRLVKVPKPWFNHVPNAEGGWRQDSGKIDADIWFWKQWQKAGNTVYIAPDVRLGHLELMVSQYDHRFVAGHFYLNEWRRRNPR